MLDASKIDHPIDLKQLKATMPTTTPTILDQISAEKAAGREPNAPRLGERVLALATGKTRQELYLESPNIARTISALQCSAISVPDGSGSATASCMRHRPRHRR